LPEISADKETLDVLKKAIEEIRARSMSSDEFNRLTLDADQRVSQARKAILSGGAFPGSASALVKATYAHFFSILPVVYKTIGTMATDYKGIYVDPRFVMQLENHRQIAFCLIHEIMHCMLGHAGPAGIGRCRIYGPHDAAWKMLHELRNIAQDAVINETIVRDLCGSTLYAIAEKPKIGVFMEGADKMSSEAVYLQMMNQTTCQILSMVGEPAPPEMPERLVDAERLFRQALSRLPQPPSQQSGQSGEGQGQQSQQGQGGGQGSGQGDQDQESEQNQGQGGDKENNKPSKSQGGAEKDQKQGDKEKQKDKGKGQAQGEEEEPSQDDKSGGNQDNRTPEQKVRDILEALYGSQFDDHEKSGQMTQEAEDQAARDGQISPREAMEKQVLGKAREIMQMGRGIGTCSAIGRWLVKIYEAAMEKQYPSWLKAFRSVVGRIKTERDHVNWARPSRRTTIVQDVTGEDFIIPTKRRFLMHMAFVVDVSGSIGEKELARGVVDVFRAAECMGRDSQITLIQVDTEVVGTETYIVGSQEYKEVTENWKKKGYVRKGSGGTMFREAFDYLLTMKRKADAVVVITDMGIGDLNSLPNPKARMIWLVNPEYAELKNHVTPPFGEIFVMDQLGKEISERER
jgi:predicted metal-dependent peptidase